MKHANYRINGFGNGDTKCRSDGSIELSIVSIGVLHAFVGIAKTESDELRSLPKVFAPLLRKLDSPKPPINRLCNHSREIVDVDWRCFPGSEQT